MTRAYYQSVVGKPGIGDECRVDRIPVTILDTEQDVNASLAWRLTVADDAGREFTVKIWQTHEIDIWWREGWRYVLSQGRGRHDGENIVLHSTTDFTVEKPDGVVDLLVIGDSHIGREARTEDFGAPYRTARQFVAAVGHAVRYNVDAVLNAGDFFDDTPTDEAISIATSGFEVLARNDIPLYFVYGNHGTDVAEQCYAHDTDLKPVHLDAEGNQVGHVALYGLDHEPATELSPAATDFEASPDADQRILLAHNEIDPPRDGSGFPVETISGQSPVAFDCILAGHLHAPESATAAETMVQHLGSTADISATLGADDESAWLVRSTTDRVEANRVQLD